jgi:two-component system, cell cycle response regulator
MSRMTKETRSELARAVAPRQPMRDGGTELEPELEGVVAAEPRYGRLKVLAVDGEPSSRVSLQQAAHRLGHECRTAKDGLEAWEMLQADRADVVLSDWTLPRMDGVELCRRIRAADGEGAYTYFIFMTGFDDREHFLRGMKAGADDYHTKPVDIEELQARLVSAGRVLSLYRKLADKNRQLRRDSLTSFHQARVDPLTGVPNRLCMDEELEVLWSQALRYGHPFAAALCDIDEFKKYNDRFGHVAGDEVLRRVAQTIRGELRQGDALYRYGGEEFLVVLPEQSLAQAACAMDRVRSGIARLAIPAPTGVVTISVGVAELDLALDRTLKDWLRRTDAALYRAKESGRNRVEARSPILPPTGSSQHHVE